MIDWRSDTVTRPVPEMLACMMQAAVGDDVFKEDPSVNALEAYAADLFGMEAALFCSSGTMSNQLAINVQTQPGDEILCDRQSHIFLYETGGLAVHSGVQAHILQGDAGRLNPEMLQPHIHAEHDWLTRTQMVCIENTVNRAGGTYYTLQEAQALRTFCNTHHLKLHIDGARIFNALTETGEDPKSWGALASLAAPISMIQWSLAISGYSAAISLKTCLNKPSVCFMMLSLVKQVTFLRPYNLAYSNA